MSTTRWTNADTVMVGAITAAGGLLRLPGIRRPRQLFDEFYANDACLYVRGPRGNCGTLVENSIVHPPLAKWLIGAGIRVFGFSPAGSRAVPLLAGTLSIALLYLLTRRVSGSTLAASVAAALLAFDFLHFLLSRAAMLDVFVVCFGLASFLGFVYDGDGDHTDRRSGLLPALRARAWLLGAGAAGGAALASKWSGGYLLAAVAVCASARAWARRRGAPRPVRRAVHEEGLLLATAFVVIPLVVYVASYAGRLHGDLLAWPWADGSWVRVFVARQRLMYRHHTGELFAHPYASPPWSWFLLKRPVVFDFVDLGRGRYQEVLAFGNPLVWWSGLAAVGATVVGVARRRALGLAEVVVTAGFVAGYLPWLVVTREEAFLYYLLPALPFLYLALALLVTRVPVAAVRGSVVVALVAASVVPFAFWRPLLVGDTLTYRQWERRILFGSCGVRGADGRERPVTSVEELSTPPPGWCWV